jgi:hypothetical protein
LIHHDEQIELLLSGSCFCNVCSGAGLGRISVFDIY